MSLAKLKTTDDDFMKMEGGAQTEDKMDGARIKQLVKENMYSGITVALVSTTLSPALAMAQGATAMMGLSTGIYGAAIAGVIGGSHYNILGPAGALVNIVSNLSAENGQDIIPWVALVAGIMSFLVYLVKFENYCTMLPSSVLEGFSFGVATTIGLGQVGFALGLYPGMGYELVKHKEFYQNVGENFSNLGHTQMKEFLVFLPLFVILMTLSKWKPAVPWIIVIAAIGIIYGVIMKEIMEPDLDIKSWKKYQSTPVLLKNIYPSLSDKVTLGQFGYWSPKKALSASAVIIGSLKVAFVAVLETLISARIADNKTNTRFNQSQEIFGMSIANIVCGLMGGTPCTGVLIRTNVNIQTGATHKMSQFINAVFVFLIVVLFMPIFTYIPMACIAAILMTSACRLVPKTIIAELWNVDRFEFWILIITWLICVFKDGAVGLLIGAFLSFLKQSEKTSETQLQIESDGKFLKVELDGSLDYINALHFETKVFDKINEDKPDFTCVNLSRALFVDIDGLIVLKQLFGKKNTQVVMVLQNEDMNSVLCKSPVYQNLKGQGKVFASMSEAQSTLSSGKGKDA